MYIMGHSPLKPRITIYIMYHSLHYHISTISFSPPPLPHPLTPPSQYRSIALGLHLLFLLIQHHHYHLLFPYLPSSIPKSATDEYSHGTNNY